MDQTPVLLACAALGVRALGVSGCARMQAAISDEEAWLVRLSGRT